jgi:hypothetical protein
VLDRHDVSELERVVACAIAGEDADARLIEVQGVDRAIWIVAFRGAWREVAIDGRGRARSVGAGAWPVALPRSA